MTPTENKALVQKIFKARLRGDPAPFTAAMADDFVWRTTGSTTWPGEYYGKDDIRERLLKPLYAQFVAPTRITPTRILADGDYAVVECHGEATTLSGKRYANTYCLVIRLEAGQLREMTEYMDTALVERVLQPPAWRENRRVTGEPAS